MDNKKKLYLNLSDYTYYGCLTVACITDIHVKTTQIGAITFLKINKRRMIFYMTIFFGNKAYEYISDMILEKRKIDKITKVIMILLSKIRSLTIFDFYILNHSKINEITKISIKRYNINFDKNYIIIIPLFKLFKDKNISKLGIDLDGDTIQIVCDNNEIY